MVKTTTQLTLFAIAAVIVGSLFATAGQTRFSGAADRSSYRCDSLSYALSSNGVDWGWSVSEGSPSPATAGDALNSIDGPMTYEYFYIADVYSNLNYHNNWADIQASCVAERQSRQTVILIVIGAALTLITIVGTSSIGAPRAEAPQTKASAERGSEET